MRSFNYLRRQGLHKRQKKLRLSGSFQAPLCKGICKCAKHACRRRRDGFCLPCARGGGPRSGGRVVKNNPSPPAAELPLHKGAVIIPDNQSFFCLLFFSKKSTVISVLLLSRRCRPRPSCRCGNSQCACRSGGKPERLCGGLPCPFRV